MPLRLQMITDTFGPDPPAAAVSAAVPPGARRGEGVAGGGEAMIGRRAAACSLEGAHDGAQLGAERCGGETLSACGGVPAERALELRIGQHPADPLRGVGDGVEDQVGMGADDLHRTARIVDERQAARGEDLGGRDAEVLVARGVEAVAVRGDLGEQLLAAQIGQQPQPGARRAEVAQARLVAGILAMADQGQREVCLLYTSPSPRD